MKSYDFRTKEEVIRLLMSSTGRALCDSGDAYGRSWERNQDKACEVLGKDAREKLDMTPGSEDLRKLVDWFDDQPVSFIEWFQGEPNPTINVYHFLVCNLTFHPQRHQWFERFVEWWDKNDEEQSWLGYAEDFPGWLAKQWMDNDDGQLAFVDFEPADDPLDADELEEHGLPADYRPSGIQERWENDQLTDDDQQYLESYLEFRHPEVGGYFEVDSREKPLVVNTYNGEDMLTQVLQYVAFSVEGERVVLLQVHQGCDVRGGYPKPRYMEQTGEYDYAITENARGDIACESGVTGGPHDDSHYWSLENGSSMSSAGYRGSWGGQSKPPVVGEEPFDMDDPDNQETLRFICQNFLPGSPEEFDPHHFWKYLTLDLFPTKMQGQEDEDLVIEQWLNSPNPGTSEVETRAIDLLRQVSRSIWDHWMDDRRMGVTFFSRNHGYCPVCGGELKFWPTAVRC